MKINRSHLVGYLISGTARLRDHIERIDSGVAYAVDDLALVLRLLVSGARGGELISRTANSYGIPLPKFGISTEPAIVQGLIWGAGALPTTAALGVGAPVDISQLRFKTALRIHTKTKSVELSWDKMIRDYANTWGTHVGDTIRDDLPLADRIGTAAGLPLSTYMLREVAVAAWFTAQFVIRNAAVQDDPGFFNNMDLGDEVEAWVSAPGGISEPPQIRGEHGKFQSAMNIGSNASWVWAVEYPVSTGVTLGELFLGGLTYRIKIPAVTGSTDSEYEVPRQRGPIEPPTLNFSEGKTVQVTPQFPRWKSTDYMAGISGFLDRKPFSN